MLWLKDKLATLGVIAVAVSIAVFKAFQFGSQTARAQAQAKQETDRLNAQKTSANVDSLSDDDVRRKLREKWSRR